MINTSLLIHIGYPKTGTTWLQRAVFTESNGYTPLGQDVKDMGWDFIYGYEENDSPFAFNSQHTIQKIEQAVQAAPSFPVISNEDLTGHPLCGGIAGRDIANKLSDVFEKPRILITIREQTSMIRSLYEHYIRTGGICSISAFLKTQNETQIPFFNPAVFEYDRLISYYQDLFGKENVLVLPYELLRNDLPEFLAKISMFTEIDIDLTNIDTSSQNTSDISLSHAAILLRHLNILWGPRRNHNMRTGPGTIQSSRKFWRALSYGAPSSFWEYRRKKLTRYIDEFVTDYYKHSNAKTESLTGLNLAALKYTL